MNPLFKNPGARDFSLQNGSLAIDSGITAGVAKDINGKTRDASPDLGAYEF